MLRYRNGEENIWRYEQDRERSFFFYKKKYKEGRDNVTEWGVFLVIVALIGFATAIITPVLKLNTTITKLIAKIDVLGKDFDEMELKNHRARERIWHHNEKQDAAIDNHEIRITSLEIRQKEGE